jgi:hypothetical protein
VSPRRRCWRHFYRPRPPHRDGDLVTRKVLSTSGSYAEAIFAGIAEVLQEAQSLQELAKRDAISRRYVRRLVNLAFLSPQLVEAILQGRQPVALNATRLTEIDLPLDWTEQSRLNGPLGILDDRTAHRLRATPSRAGSSTGFRMTRRWREMDSKFQFPDAHVTLTGVYTSRTRLSLIA